MLHSRTATGSLPWSRRLPPDFGLVRSTKRPAPLYRSLKPSTVSLVRAMGTLRELRGSPLTPWLPSPTGRKNDSPAVAQTRIKASIFFESQRIEVRTRGEEKREKSQEKKTTAS